MDRREELFEQLLKERSGSFGTDLTFTRPDVDFEIGPNSFYANVTYECELTWTNYEKGWDDPGGINDIEPVKAQAVNIENLRGYDAEGNGPVLLKPEPVHYLAASKAFDKEWYEFTEAAIEVISDYDPRMDDPRMP